MTRILFAGACLLALAACQRPASETPAGTDAARPTANTAPMPAAAAVHGSATYLERMAPPPGATLSVQLIDTLLADTSAAVIASAEFKDAKGPPFEFTLPYDAARLRANGQYGLHAGLRDAGGNLWFVTDTRVPVTPGSAEPVKLRMVRAGAVPAADASDPTHWQCGDQRITARFDNVAAQVVLDVGDARLTLPQARSGSGARYADAAGNAFWNTGRTAMLTRAGQTRVDCTRTASASPWDAARARGAVFRALGTEPGWSAEISGGGTPALQAELDYGERTLHVARLQSVADGFAGKTADGVDVRLQTRRETCSDGMSDTEYPASATLVVGDKTYRGCGRHLSE